MTPKLKLTYFGLPGRAEVTRVLLAIGNVPFEDAVVTHDTWPALKPHTPFGQIPILEVDGVVLAQSGAIERYAAQLVGLIPKDPIDAAKAEMASLQLQDAFNVLLPTFSLPEVDARVKARTELLEGKLGGALKALDAYVALTEGDYILGSQLSWVDVQLWSGLSMMQCGMVDGIPKDLINRYPALKKLHSAVASVPAVAARYADTTDPIRLAYKASA